MRFSPRNNSFYDMFATSGQNLVTGAGLLKELLGADPADRADRRADARRRARRRRGDPRDHARAQRDVRHAVRPRGHLPPGVLASTTSWTPWRRPSTSSCSTRSASCPPELADQVEVLQRAAELTAEAMPRLRGMKNLAEYWIEINRLENQADQVYRRLLAQPVQRRVRRAHGDEAQGGRRPARGGRRRLRARREHGRDDRGQGVLTGGASRHHRGHRRRAWSSTTPTASTTRRTRSRPRSRPGR